MAVTETTPPDTGDAGTTEAPRPAGPGALERVIGTGDHTTLGRMFIGFSLLLLVAALVATAIGGIDTAADNGILGAYYQMVTLSSLVALVFLGVVPLLIGLALVVVPLQVGSPAIAFPRAAALALWGWLVSGAIFIVSMALDGGVGGGDLDGSRLGNVALGGVMVSLALASVCIATTVLAHRPAGMGLARVPLFSWSMLLACSIWIVSFGAAVAWSVIGHIGAPTAPALLGNFSAGQAWLLRGPAVYMLAIPVLGIAADAVAGATGRPLRNYGIFQGAIGAFAVLSFGAWAQSPASLNTIVWTGFALAVGLPVLVLLGGLAESMRHGRVPTSAGVVGSLLALVLVLGAVVVGLLMALDTAGEGNLFDFVPAALTESQAVFVATAAVAGALAGIAHWGPLVWGRAPKEPAATGSIGLVDVGGGLFATTVAVRTFVQAGGDDTAEVLFAVLVTVGAVLMVLGVAGSAASWTGSGDDEEDKGDEGADGTTPGGLTLEWGVAVPARGGSRTEPVPVVTSPYPLAESEEDS